MKPNRAVLESWTGQRLVGVKGTPLQVCGTAQMELKLGEETFQSRVVVVDGLTADVILGLDFWKLIAVQLTSGRRSCISPTVEHLSDYMGPREPQQPLE